MREAHAQIVSRAGKQPDAPQRFLRLLREKKRGAYVLGV